VQDAGADVTVMDFADVKLKGAKAIHINLGEQASIDTALQELGDEPIDALFSCAGVADGTSRCAPASQVRAHARGTTR